VQAHVSGASRQLARPAAPQSTLNETVNMRVVPIRHAS